MVDGRGCVDGGMGGMGRMVYTLREISVWQGLSYIDQGCHRTGRLIGM